MRDDTSSPAPEVPDPVRDLVGSHAALPQFIRYGLLSVVLYAWTLGGTYALVEWLGLAANLAYFLILTVNLVVGYVLNARLVFGGDLTKGTAGRYFVFRLTFFVANNALFNVLFAFTGLHYLAIVVVNIVLLSAVRFLILRTLVFPGGPGAPGPGGAWMKLAARGLVNPGKVVSRLPGAWRQRRAEVLLVSHPKTGRTWLRIMLVRALSGGGQDDDLLDLYATTRRVGARTTLSFPAERYRSRHVVFLVRDIRDVLVSFYFEATKRSALFEGSLPDFLRDPALGARKVVAYYNWWYEHRSVPVEFLLLRYADIHRDPAAELRRVLDVLGASVDDQAVADAVAFGRFDTMRSVEAESQDARLAASRPGDPESRKVRRGEVGGYTEYLSGDDLAYVDEVVATMGLPGCDWYFEQDRPTRGSPGGGPTPGPR